MSVKNKFPNIKPSLNLDFANTKQLDPRITFTRASTATYWGSFGLLRTAQAGVPRFDHNPVTGESLGLLIEEQRTNLLTYSDQISAAEWLKVGVSVSADATVAPDGTISADLLTVTGATPVVYQSPTRSSATYTLSVYAKAGTAGIVGLRNDAPAQSRAVFSLINGTVTLTPDGTTTSIVHVGNGWYRCSMTFTAAVVNAVLDCGSTVGNNVYLWGAQLEEGAFPTSYIPTTTAQVTRAADAAVMTGANFSSWYRQGEGTLYGEMISSAALTGVSNRDAIFGFDSGLSAVDVIGIGKNYAGGSPNGVFVAVASAGTFEAFFANSGPVSAGVPYKVAAAVKDNDVALSVSGAQPSTDTSVNVPKNIIQARIGSTSQNAAANGHIKRIAYYPKRLSNAELQALTA